MSGPDWHYCEWCKQTWPDGAGTSCICPPTHALVPVALIEEARRHLTLCAATEPRGDYRKLLRNTTAKLAAYVEGKKL